MTPTRLRVRSNTMVQIKRRLSQGHGRFKVHPGYEVTPEAELGEGQVVSGYKIVDLAKMLGVDPKDGLIYIKKKLGQSCFKGELIAEKAGILGMGAKQITAVTDGVLESYEPQHGHLKIKLNPKREVLMSGVYGIVDFVDPKRGEVMIRTQATVILGMIGSGREREGTLRFLTNNTSLLVSSRQVTPDFSGQIVVGGSMIFSDALQKCVSLGVPSLITGGINASDFRTISGGKFHLQGGHWSDVGMSLLVTEGFGSNPIGPDIYHVLLQHEGQFCLIDGNNRQMILPTQDPNSIIYIRKIKNPLLPNPYLKGNDLIGQDLKLGMKVRVVSDPVLGSQGIVSHIDQVPTMLPNGLAVIMITIDGKEGRQKVPAANVEILI